MSRIKKISQSIEELEYKLAKLNFVKQHYPDAQVHNDYFIPFTSEQVNKNYTNFDFEDGWSTLNVMPYTKLEFIYNNNAEVIKIHSRPKRKRLARITWKNRKRTLTFTKLAINLKHDNFKEELLQECKKEIVRFMQKHPKLDVDYTHLDPKIKQILLFL